MLEIKDFADLDAWVKYKSDRERKNDEIELLQLRLEKAQKSNNRLSYGLLWSFAIGAIWSAACYLFFG
ncbi:MAG: hypothetical protein PHY23_00415 [Oscillospiraceae bacterium]|nr:hypothetical protein [Oscillospiraceae bacterium]